MATRSSTDEGFGTPVRLPEPVNSSPTKPARRSPTVIGLYFSSDRDDPSYDIYVSKRGPNGWSEPENLGPNINTPGWLDEAAAFYEDGGDQVMLFSSRQAGGSGDGNIYQSVNGGPKSLVAGGPNSSASDNRPSVTRDGLTIFFDSTRSGGLGGPDLYYATRSSTSEPFGPAIHLGGLSSSVFDARAHDQQGRVVPDLLLAASGRRIRSPGHLLHDEGQDHWPVAAGARRARGLWGGYGRERPTIRPVAASTSTQMTRPSLTNFSR